MVSSPSQARCPVPPEIGILTAEGFWEEGVGGKEPIGGTYMSGMSRNRDAHKNLVTMS